MSEHGDRTPDIDADRAEVEPEHGHEALEAADNPNAYLPAALTGDKTERDRRLVEALHP